MLSGVWHVQTNVLTDFTVQWLEQLCQTSVLLLAVVENLRKQWQRHPKVRGENLNVCLTGK